MPVLLVDERTLGLAPRVITEILEVLRQINRNEGITVLFIEQNVQLALSLAHRGYILESGRLLLDGSAEALMGPEGFARSISASDAPERPRAAIAKVL